MPITSASLAQYRRSVLVETGTFRGDGTQAALDAGFEKVYTVEVYPPLYRAACNRFANEPRVELFEGSSIVCLRDILPLITKPAVFWLDSHTCGGESGGAYDTPLIGELRLIAEHPIKTHVILIDDVHLFGLELPGMPEVMMRLTHINPMYRHYFISSAEPSLGPDILASEV